MPFYNSKRDFGRDILGPIFFEFCAKLHRELEKRDDGDKPLALFMSRAGLRLRFLYETYIRKQGIRDAAICKDFFVSRLSCAKGCLIQNFPLVAKIIISEYRGKTLGELANQVCNVKLPAHLKDRPVSFESFAELYDDKGGAGKSLRYYFIQQNKLLERYLIQLIGERSQVVLVDSGWRGSTQAMLMDSFPAISWQGLYFGRWTYGRPAPAHFDCMTGLSVDDIELSGSNPRKSVFRYHHLIEDPLEPVLPSISEYTESRGIVLADLELQGDVTEQSITHGSEHFSGIIQYFFDASPSSIDFVKDQSDWAFRKLQKLILFPKRADLDVMTVGARSADFGKSETNSPLIKSSNSWDYKAKRSRIRRALWGPGQIALEFPAPIARVIQHLLDISPRV